MNGVRRIESIVILFAVALVAAVLWSAQRLPPQAQQFPRLIAAVMLVLLIAQFVAVQRHKPGQAEKPIMDIRIGVGRDAREMMRRAGGFSLWMLGLLVAVYVLGFRIGGIGVLFLYVRYGFRERWLVAGAVTLAVAAILTIGVEVLHTPVHRGVVF